MGKLHSNLLGYLNYKISQDGTTEIKREQFKAIIQQLAEQQKVFDDFEEKFLTAKAKNPTLSAYLSPFVFDNGSGYRVYLNYKDSNGKVKMETPIYKFFKLEQEPKQKEPDQTFDAIPEIEGIL